VTALVNIAGFVLSAILAWVFSGALREGYLGGYDAGKSGRTALE
jgi:hypothetical protein